jgi:hypothetical protein
MGAVAWAMRQRSVSHPRSSNRTCGFPASGSPTGFTVRHTEEITNRKRHLRGVFLPSPNDTAFSEGPGSVGVCRLSANHLHLAIFESTPEVRVLPSTGITRLQRSYDPVRLPPMPLPRSNVQAAALTPNGSPPITRTTFPTCRAHYPGGSSGCSCRLLSPLTRPSPSSRRVGVRIVTFEACSGFTHVTARRIAQPPRGDLCHEAPARAVTRTSRSSATGSIDNSPGGIFLH